MSGSLSHLASVDPAILVGCGLAVVAFLMALPSLIVRLGKTEDGAR